MVRSGMGHSAVIFLTHRWLLASVSAIAMFAVAIPANARPLGGGTTTPSTATLTAAQSAQIEAQRAARAANGALQRATRAVQAMQAVQKAARDAALAAPGGVPNGLVAGGLQVAPGAVPGSTLWQGANLPTQSVDGDRSNVSVEQTQQKAILTWQSFNVGKDTTLYFDQRAGGADAKNWIALNRVIDPTAAPSRILGSIKADGQVYIINRNGIIFGGSSQVNVGSLVASSLSMSNQQFMAGIAMSVTYDPAGPYTVEARPTFGDVPLSDSATVGPPPAGNVTVAAGARINSGKYGLIGLFGTNVTNAGTIATDGGQVLMAAGEQVWIAAHDNINTGMVGVRAFVSALPAYYTANVDDPVLFQKLTERTTQVGMVTRNEGLVEATAGNITLVGATVRQNGIVQAVSTLDHAGSIFISGQASALYNYYGSAKLGGGTVEFGESSISQILVDRSGTLGTGGTAGSASLLRIIGTTVELKGKAATSPDDLGGALVKAEAGKIDISLVGAAYSTSAFLDAFDIPGAPVAGTRLLMNAGSILDVSGALDVEVAMERNSVEVEVRANEVRDTPLQRGGILLSKNIWVDRRVSGKREDGTTWYGTEVVDANDYIANVPTTMAERAVKGGTITIRSNEVIVQPNATVNIAGGSIRYLDGYVRTTTLVAANGATYNIGDAPPDLTYLAIGAGFTRTHARWGVSETWSSQLRRSDRHFEKGYAEGADAGTLTIYAPTVVLDGSIVADAMVGERQANSAPAGGTMTLGSISPPDNLFNPEDLRVQANAGTLAAGFTMASALPADRIGGLVLSTDMLNESGLSNVSLYLVRNALFAPDTDLKLQPGSKFSVYAYNGTITVDGKVSMPGGTFSLLSDYGGGSASAGSLIVKDTTRIDVSGQWVNELVSLQTTRATLNAGSISLSSAGAGSLQVEDGAVLIADAGGRLTSKGQFKAGNAGRIDFASPKPFELDGVAVSAYGVASNDLVDAAPSGGTLGMTGTFRIAPNATSIGNVVGLDPNFFDRGGFGTFVLNVSEIADGVTVAPKVQTRILSAGAVTAVSADSISGVSTVATLSASQRAGATLNFTVPGGFRLGANTVLDAGIGGSVLIKAAGALTIGGQIQAPAGAISLSTTVANSSITLESTARLLAEGASRIASGVHGQRSGSVLAGGSVSISSTAANLAVNMARGSLIDVSGTSGTIDVIDVQERQSFVPLTLASDGGAVTIAGTGLIEGSLVGNPGGSGAAGGSLSLGASYTSSAAAIPSTVYYQVNGVWTARTAAQDLDINNEYAGSAITYTSVVAAERTKILNATRTGSGGMLTIIDDETLAPGRPGWVVPTSSLAETDPTLLQNSLNAADLYTKYFYSRSGTSAANYVYTKLKYAAVPTELVVRHSSFEDGGFGSLSLNGSQAGVRLGPNVDISASRSIGVNASAVTNWPGASATLRAPMVSLIGGKAVTSVANPGGVMSVLAQQITMSGAFKGFAKVDLRSAGDMVVSTSYVDGDLTLAATQVYAATEVTATINASRSITVEANGSPSAAPLSAASILVLNAPTITQNGTLRAPFGQITLNAAERLILGPGSVTSVSGAGVVLPYGSLKDEVYWYSGLDTNQTSPLTAPPEKRVTLKAPVVDMRSGAVVDLSGGGDLLASQFITGAGGSSNWLSTATYPAVVAIMPVSMVSHSVGQRILSLAGGYGIPAGDYVVLPASYALLPGAYRLETLTTSSGQPIYDYVRSARLPDGSVVMAGLGHVGGTDIRDQRIQAYKVSSIDTVKLHSEYKIWTANDYFASSDFVEAMRRYSGLEVTAIPRLPKDAGALQIEATASVSLNGTLAGSAAEGARGAVVDLSASKIAIIGGVDATGYRAAGYLVLDTGQLSALGAESLLLGGTRKQTTAGLEVDAVAGSIIVATDGTEANALVAPEVLLASENTIQIDSGSIIEARGSVGSGSGNILIKPVVAQVVDTKNTADPADDVITTAAMDYGAFVRVSNGETVRAVRTGATNTQGTLTIGAASLRGKAIILDATKTTTVAASADLRATALDVSSGRISIGTPTGTPDGLVLSGSSLEALAAASSLSLRSYSSIDFYGGATIGSRNADGSFGLARLELDAVALNGAAGAQVAIAAGDVVFSNSSAATATGLGGAGGSLTVEAATITLGAGAKTVAGFDRVELEASRALLGSGTGSIDFKSANLVIAAPLLSAASGASQDWVTTGTFQLAGPSAGSAFDTLGGRLSITASAIVQGGLIDLAAGSLSLRATSGDVVLASGSVTRAAGVVREFYEQSESIAGGRIALTADQGRVDAAAGSLIDLSGNGAKGGTLAIASTQAVRLDGTLSGDGGGSFTLDTGSIPSFAALAAKLAAGNFNRDISVRLRSGDLTVDGVTRASSFAAAADAGNILVTGTIDVSGTAGGTITLAARQDLTVAAGARLAANASDAGQRSGLIDLSSSEGVMDLRAGARIEALGGRNGDGDIKLRFRRNDATGTVGLVGAAASMSAARIVAEAYRDYTTTSVDATLSTALADAAAFMNTYAAGIEASLGRALDPTFHLVPGIELASSGDLALSSAVDLHAARYDGEAGVLTLRAAGNLLLSGSLSDGFASAAASATVLTDTASWSYRLVGGAELAAADPLAVRSIGAFTGGTSGNVRLASNTIVRTGTGRIDVAAGYDATLADQTAVIYTAGAKIADPSLGGTYTVNVVKPAFTSGGGDITVRAQNDMRTLVPGTQNIVEWLWRTGRIKADGSFEKFTYSDAGTPTDYYKQTAWWVNFARFQQGIAALGGGNVSVTAGRDIANTSVTTVTQGRVGGGRTAGEAKTIAITGGGDLTVAAGRDILGGVYYVDGGIGSIAAGRNLGADYTITYTPTGRPVYVRRVNPVLAIGNAVLSVTAGGNVEIGGAGNPTQWLRSSENVAAFNESAQVYLQSGYFSTQTERTALSVTTIGGNVTLWNDPRTSTSPTTAVWNEYLVYYPATTKVVAASGDIRIVNGMLVLPGATGNLDLWAQGSLYFNLQGQAGVRELAVGSMPASTFGTILRPNSQPGGSWYGAPDAGYLQTKLDQILHLGDPVPSRFYAVSGDIVSGTSAFTPFVYVGEQAWFRAGHDIIGLRLRVQNSQASDLTLLSAGRDINLSRAGYPYSAGVSIDGPGFALVEAGRDVYLGKGGGIETVGDGATLQSSQVIYRNTALPSGGADLLVLAGMADGPAYDAFVAAYLDPANVANMPSHLVSGGRPIYLDQLVAFMRQVTGNPLLSDAGALAAIRDDRFADYRKFLINAVLSKELRAAGRGKVDGLGAGLGYERGYAAIATLYPGAERKDNTGWQGDVVMDVSKIRTYLGGNLDITAPGGNLQVSALSSTATGENNGVLTINGGEIRILTGLDTIINTSRILTARGGDITIWASYGDIDAGKGKKSALTNPPVTYALSLDGSISYTVNPSFTGSGISTQKGTPDAPISSVDLYAPDGIINAGDAGIRSSGAIYLGALEIRGAENIRAGGEIKGIPKPAPSSASLTVETKDKAAADAVRDASQSGVREQPSVIIVEVLGYGGGDTGAPSGEGERQRKREQDQEQGSYDPNSIFRVVGSGALTEEQKQKLTGEERANLESR